jgi:protein phosphatase
MTGLTSYSVREIGARDHLEDYVLDRIVQTAGGLRLLVALVCDGSGGGSSGERASRHAARTMIDYLEISRETSVPVLLVGAVEEANREVYQELSGAGTTTVALVAINLDDTGSPHGRLFTASIGDSLVYLVRDRQLIRLNIDHILSNEYIYAGQMTREEAQRLPNASYITRIIGANPEVQVDIGIYAERGKAFVNSVRAFNIGKHGLLLRDGDTIIVASAGLMSGIVGDAAATVCQPQELIDHASATDVRQAISAIMTLVMSRRPVNNVSLAMIYVPSGQRQAALPTPTAQTAAPTLTATPLPPQPRTQPQNWVAFAGVIVVLLLVTLLLGIGFLRAENELQTLRATQNALSETIIPATGE